MQNGVLRHLALSQSRYTSGTDRYIQRAAALLNIFTGTAQTSPAGRPSRCPGHRLNSKAASRVGQSARSLAVAGQVLVVVQWVRGEPDSYLGNINKHHIYIYWIILATLHSIGRCIGIIKYMDQF